MVECRFAFMLIKTSYNCSTVDEIYFMMLNVMKKKILFFVIIPRLNNLLHNYTYA